jgi:hypothetical protein
MVFDGAILLVSGVVLLSGLSTLSSHTDIQVWQPDTFAQIGVVMFALMVTVVWLQARQPFSWVLMAEVGVAGALLFLTFLNHAFPEKSRLFAVPHLVVGVIFIGWNLWALWKAE